MGSIKVVERTNSFVLGLVFIETGSCVNDIYNIGDFIKCQLTKSNFIQLINIRTFTQISLQSPLLFLIYSFSN